MSIALIIAVVAAILFGLAALGIGGRVNLTAAGWCLLTIALIISGVLH